MSNPDLTGLSFWDLERLIRESERKIERIRLEVRDVEARLTELEEASAKALALLDGCSGAADGIAGRLGRLAAMGGEVAAARGAHERLALQRLSWEGRRRVLSAGSDGWEMIRRRARAEEDGLSEAQGRLALARRERDALLDECHRRGRAQ